MNVPFMWYKNFGRSFFHFITIHWFDRQTEILWLIPPCIVCSTLKCICKTAFKVIREIIITTFNYLTVK